MPKIMMIGRVGDCPCDDPRKGVGRVRALKAGSYRGSVGRVLSSDRYCARIRGEKKCFRTQKALNKALRKRRR